MEYLKVLYFLSQEYYAVPEVYLREEKIQSQKILHLNISPEVIKTSGDSKNNY
jgi:hypothetical protein